MVFSNLLPVTLSDCSDEVLWASVQVPFWDTQLIVSWLLWTHQQSQPAGGIYDVEESCFSL